MLKAIALRLLMEIFTSLKTSSINIVSCSACEYPSETSSFSASCFASSKSATEQFFVVVSIANI